MRGRNAFFAANADEKACFGAHEARSEKREARSEKREARSEKREARKEYEGKAGKQIGPKPYLFTFAV
ncbi:hypothetical protein P4S70_02855 [Enterovibrio sp. Hal110]